MNTLSKDKSIGILPADKGRVTVVFNWSEYESKIEKLVSDKETYELLKADPTKTVKIKLINKLKEFKKNDQIQDKLYKRLYPTSESVPKLYGLLKIHKKDAPLRPIVSSVGSVMYPVADYLATVIGPLAGKTDHHIVNSTDFVQKIQVKRYHQETNLCPTMCPLFSQDYTCEQSIGYHQVQKRKCLMVLS